MLIYLSLLDTPEEKLKFEEIYNSYKHTMFYVAKGILVDVHLAEDAVHEAFIRIAKNLHKISEVSSPQSKSFAVTIVKRVSLSMLEEIKGENISYDEFEEVLADEYMINDNLFAKIDFELIVTEILKLPHIYKDVLYFECIEEFSNKEISKLLGITIEAAKKRSQRGKKMLIENLKKEGVLIGK